MTCIVALANSKTVHMGADRLSTDWDTSYETLFPKIFVHETQEFLFGCCGEPRMQELLRYTLKPPSYQGEWDLWKYMATVFMDAVRTTFKEKGFLRTYSGQEYGGVFLVALKGGHLFKVESNFQVTADRAGYMVIGTGENYALGSLFTSAHSEELDPQERLRIALEATERHCLSVQGPFDFLQI